ncbi:hyoscyamine 6-dioxygenase-like [Coffea arabica]|uniref:Hyoscyamine 6-dioxygenase-like n=1 Tax=Coffea arabica TaxID=13443 RepID=A0ABM4U699_COFAR
MASPASSWSSTAGSLPAKYVAPAEERPGAFPIPISNEIPVIDLGMQMSVINHGVPRELMIEAINMGKEFFGMSIDEKAIFCKNSAKTGKEGYRMYTSSPSLTGNDFE